MIIGLFTDTYLPDINGVVSSTDLLRRKLEEMGNTVYVVCTYPGLVGVKKEGNIIRLPGVVVKQLYGYAVTQPFHISLLNEMADYHFDILHIQTEFGVGVFGAMVAKKYNIPVVRTYHTTYEDYTHYLNFINSDSLDKKLKKVAGAFSKAVGNHCVELISPSLKTKELLLSYNIKTPISIIPTGIELYRFKQSFSNDVINQVKEECKVKDDELMILFVGRIASEKSLDTIIRSFIKVKENKLKIKLVILGGGPQLDELINLSNSLDLNDYITFLNKRPFDEVPKYYHAADAFISASTSETQGMTYIEALASNLPVLAHYDEVLDDIVEEGTNGYFFNSEEEIYPTIKKFYDLSIEDRRKMSINASRSVDQYDADVFGQKVYNLYVKAIEEFNTMYLVSKVDLKNNIVKLEITKGINDKEKLIISLDDFYNEGIKLNENIEKNIYEKLKNKENEVIAYQNCLKKLGIRDFSVNKIVEYLRNNYELSDETIKEIVKKLESYDLLDDKAFANSKINIYKQEHYSRKKMFNKLANEGIDEETINEAISNISEDEEKDNCLYFANKYSKQIKNKSAKLKKQTIIEKLINDGFKYDLVNSIIEELVLEIDSSIEKELLHKEARKAYIRYKKKHDGYELRTKIFLYLCSKGFTTDDINEELNKLEEKQ